MQQLIALIFDLIRLAPLAAILFIAAQQDHKTGEVKNKLWLYFIIGGLLSVINYTVFYPEFAALAVTSAGVAVAISLILFYVGGWAGADGKALITIGCSAPLTPVIFGQVTFTPLIVLWVSFAAGIIYALAKHKKQIRFLPAILLGFIVACLV
jgi:Flp pilus assembly protein protease CpaA